MNPESATRPDPVVIDSPHFGRTTVPVADIELLSDFTGVTFDECVERLRTYRPDEMAAAWRQAAPQTPADIWAFYSSTELYLWELLLWNGSAEYEPHLRAVEHLARLFPPASHRRVLDFGAGIGSVALRLAEVGYEVVLADIPGKSLDFAAARMRRRDHSFEILAQRPEGARLPRSTFDALVSFDVIEHLPNPADVTRQLVRSLRVGGGAAMIVAFADPGDHPHHLAEGIRRFSGRRWELFLNSLGMKHVGEDVYERTGAAQTAARRVRYLFWKLTGLTVEHVPR